MVQYVFTPWRDRHELLLVRQQFYDSDNGHATISTTTTAAAPESQQDDIGQQPQPPSQQQQQRQLKEQAVSRVSMWMQRGNCPHMVESTALLTAAMLSDGRISTGASTYTVRAAYSAAFSRYVLPCWRVLVSLSLVICILTDVIGSSQASWIVTRTSCASRACTRLQRLSGYLLLL